MLPNKFITLIETKKTKLSVSKREHVLILTRTARVTDKELEFYIKNMIEAVSKWKIYMLIKDFTKAPPLTKAQTKKTTEATEFLLKTHPKLIVHTTLTNDYGNAIADVIARYQRSAYKERLLITVGDVDDLLKSLRLLRETLNQIP